MVANGNMRELRFRRNAPETLDKNIEINSKASVKITVPYVNPEQLWCQVSLECSR